MSRQRSTLRRATNATARFALASLDRVVGGASPRIRSVCRFLVQLIDEGRDTEFDALMRHGVGRIAQFASRGSARVVRSSTLRRFIVGAPLRIDARNQMLLDDGTIAPKPVRYSMGDGTASCLASIVIPCFNYGRYLPEAVESALAQTLASCEVIVVDDGSTDPVTVAVVDRLATEGRVTVIRQDNSGLSSARNTGIAQARGEYICCLDADDTLAPTYLEQMVAVLEADRSVGFAYSWVQFFEDDQTLWETRDFDIDMALLGNSTSVSAVYRRDDWAVSGGYRPEMKGGYEDWEFWIRLATLGRRGQCVRSALFFHRRHGRTMTHTAHEMMDQLRQRMRELNPRFYDDGALRRRLKRLVPVPAAPAELPFVLLNVGGRAPTRPGLLVAVAWLERGGAEVLLLEILRGLAADWHIVLVTTQSNPHPMTAEFRAVTGDIFHLDGFLPPEQRLDFVSHLVETRRVTTVLSSGSVWILDHLPTLATLVPGLRVFDILHNHTPAGPMRAAIANTQLVTAHVAVSSLVARALADCGIPGNRIATVPNGIDVDAMFNPLSADRSVMRADLDIAEEETLLLWVGRFSSEKRPLAFVAIVEELARRHPVRGLMIGDGPQAPEVARAVEAKGLGRRLALRPHVPRDSLPGFYAAADCLVLTSTVEGLPLVIIEALGTGCPVAATRVGDVPAIVRDGENGYLVDPERVDDLAAPLAEAITGARLASMRAAAAASVRNSAYTRSSMVAGYARLLSGGSSAST